MTDAINAAIDGGTCAEQALMDTSTMFENMFLSCRLYTSPPNRIRITLAARMALLRRPARATTRMLVAVLKRRVLRFP